MNTNSGYELEKINFVMKILHLIQFLYTVEQK